MMRDRARAGWDRVRIAVSELSWRRFRRVFRKKRRAVVEGPVLSVELVGTVLWMAWESWRGKDMARREATAEQTAAEQLAQQQKRVQRVQQKNAAITAGEEWVDEWEVAGYFSEGYYSSSNSDCSSAVLSGDKEAEVAATEQQ